MLPQSGASRVHIFDCSMFDKNSRLNKVISYQNLGFLAIILICFFNDLLKFPQLVLSDHPQAALFRESTFEILLVFAVWYLVSSSTRRVIERIRYLEKFMRVCAWCRRIDYQGRWLPLEEFLQHGFDTPTTHGICQDCFERQRTSLEEAKKNLQAEAPKTEITSGP